MEPNGSHRDNIQRNGDSTEGPDSLKIVMPVWVHHEGKPIYSVDIHPDSGRFATGGGDMTAKIWNMAPLLHESKEVGLLD